MGGPGSGRHKGGGSKRIGLSKLSGKKVAFGKTKGYASTKIAARETNKMFSRRDKRNSANTKRLMKG